MGESPKRSPVCEGLEKHTAQTRGQGFSKILVLVEALVPVALKNRQGNFKGKIH